MYLGISVVAPWLAKQELDREADGNWEAPATHPTFSSCWTTSQLSGKEIPESLTPFTH